MQYLKVDIQLVPNEEWFRDVLIAKLGEIGFESFMESDKGLEAFIPGKDFTEVALNKMLAEQPSSVEITWSKEILEDKNWNEEWEKNYFKPLLVADQCLVRAPFHQEYPVAEYEIVIEPNMAFGTGNHETTSMMVEAILSEDLAGKSVLDIGCGTGILGILASMKGAEKITAVDISEWAVSGTEENAALNKVNNIAVELGDASMIGNETYDFIFANIHKNVLLQDMPVYSRHLSSGGKLLLSGFYNHDLEEITQTAKKQRLKFLSHQSRRNWVVAVVQKQKK